MNSGQAQQNNDEIFKRLERTIDRKAVAEHIRDKHGDEIVNLVIGHAKAGLGLNDQAYPDYSEKYKKRIKKAGGGKMWLRGIGKTGRSGGMLDPANFEWEIDASGGLWLVWKAADERMAIYGSVHNDGLPLGRNGPRKPRPWMHVGWKGGQAAVAKMVEGVVQTLVEQFNRGQ